MHQHLMDLASSHPTMFFLLLFGWDDILIAFALMVVSTVITSLSSKVPGQKDPSPALLQDFSIPQIAEGSPQIVVFGDVWLTQWQVLWYGNLKSEAISGGGGGGKK